MVSDYQKYEKACKKIREENDELLTEFGKWLAKKNLGEKTIQQHRSNIDFYINEFLLYEDAVKAAEGASHIGMFLGYWFIKKASWSSAPAIRSNAASLKKFYQFMLERGLVSKDAVAEMYEIIKEEMDEWIATVRRYDDESITDPNEIGGL